MNWYVVYRGRKPGVYKSWRTYQDQVVGYSNNSYEGFETLVEAQYSYSNFLSQQHAMEDVAREGNMMVAEQMVANQAIAQMYINYKPSRIKDFVILVLVIVKLLLF